jgi:hypothetical protein
MAALISKGWAVSRGAINIKKKKKKKKQLLLGSQTCQSLAPTLPWGQWASLRYTSFAWGWGSCGFQEHICDVNSSACRAFVSSFYTFHVFQLSTATFSQPFLCTFSYIHASFHLWTYNGLDSTRRLHTSLFYAYT